MCAPSHFGLRFSGGESERMCGFSASFRIGTRRAAEHEGPAHVDVLHQVVLLRLKVERAREVDDARVVDDDVDPAELALGLEHRLGHVIVVAHVADDRKRLPAGGADLLGGGVDGALELGVRGVGLGEQRDVRAVARSAQCDGEADAAAAARHEDGLAGELLLGHRDLLAGVSGRIWRMLRRRPRRGPSRRPCRSGRRSRPPRRRGSR